MQNKNNNMFPSTTRAATLPKNIGNKGRRGRTQNGYRYGTKEFAQNLIKEN